MERPSENLIYDRTLSDVQRVAELNRKISADSASAEEVQEWFSAKGALNYEDLNRIESWTEFLSNQLKSYGYNAPITKRAEQTYTYYEKPEPGGEPVARLPEGYRELTYIESTGTQYVDTGFVPNQDTRMVLDFQASNTVDARLIGTRESTILNNFSFGTSGSNFYMGYNDTPFKSDVLLDTNRHVADVNKNVYKIDGTVLNTFTYGAFIGYGSIYISTFNATTIKNTASIKIYSCQIYDNDVLVRDFIPCRNPSGDVGLYDIVTKQFFGNAGTGTFLQGEAVVSLPEGYERAHYIESAGTQYIDADFIPNQDTRIVADFVLTGGTNEVLFGARVSSTSDGICFYKRASGAGYFASQYNDTIQNTTVLSDTVRHTVDLNKNVTYIDGKSVLTHTAGTFTAPVSMYLFASNDNGTVKYYAKAIIYSCQIYDNGTLVRDYIPCKDSTGVFGLYDLVEGKFYGNAGTGTFTAGEVVENVENVGGGPNKPTAITVTYTDWRVWDIPELTEINRIRGNVNSLRDGFYNLSDWREIAYKNNPNYEDVNSLEWDMQTIYNWLKLMVLNFKHSGEAYAGEAW